MMGGKGKMDESLQSTEAAVAEDFSRGLMCTADFPESGEKANDVGGSSRGGGTKSSPMAADGAGSPPPDVSSINIEFSRPSKVAKSLDFDRIKQSSKRPRHGKENRAGVSLDREMDRETSRGGGRGSAFPRQKIARGMLDTSNNASLLRKRPRVPLEEGTASSTSSSSSQPTANSQAISSSSSSSSSSKASSSSSSSKASSSSSGATAATAAAGQNNMAQPTSVVSESTVQVRAAMNPQETSTSTSVASTSASSISSSSNNAAAVSSAAGKGEEVETEEEEEEEEAPKTPPRKISFWEYRKAFEIAIGSPFYNKQHPPPGEFSPDPNDKWGTSYRNTAVGKWRRIPDKIWEQLVFREIWYCLSRIDIPYTDWPTMFHRQYTRFYTFSNHCRVDRSGPLYNLAIERICEELPWGMQEENVKATAKLTMYINRNNKKIEGIQEEAAKTALLDAMHKANDKALAFCMGSHGRLGEKSPMTRLDANLLRMIMARTYLCSDFDEGRIIDDDETDAVLEMRARQRELQALKKETIATLNRTQRELESLAMRVARELGH